MGMDEFLKGMGYSWPVRKIAGSMSVTLIIDGSQGEGIKTEFKTVLKTTTNELSFTDEVVDYGLTSSEKFTISPIRIENNKLYYSTKIECPGISLLMNSKYERDGAKLTLKQRLKNLNKPTVEELIGFRYFELKE